MLPRTFTTVKTAIRTSKSVLLPGMARNLSSFRVLGLQQIAIGGLNKNKLSALWEGALQVPKVGDYQSSKENVDEDILLLGR